MAEHKKTPPKNGKESFHVLKFIVLWLKQDGFQTVLRVNEAQPSKPTIGILYTFGVDFKRMPPTQEVIFMAKSRASKESRERENAKKREERAAKKIAESSKPSGIGRTRNFATVVYPDSAPDGWQDILSEQHMPAFISPLHDKDVNPDGEIKKPHWHVMFVFEGVKSDEQVRTLIDTIGGVGLERVNSLRGYARYLCHMDNPEKHQYLPEEVRSLCGADYIGAIGLVTDKYKAIGEMIDYCEENGIVSFAELLIYARSNRFDWFRVLCDNGAVITDKFLKSKAWTEHQQRGHR